MTMPTYLVEDVLDLFKDLNAIKFAEPGVEFLLHSGRQSRYYLDCRLVTLDSGGAYALSEMFVHSISTQLDALASDKDTGDKVYVGATGVGGIPIVGAILHQVGDMILPWQGFVVRSSGKDYGLERRIEGHCAADGHVVLVEDVITTGSSILDAAAAVEDMGFKPIGVHCIVDREEGGKARLEAAGLPLFSLLRLSDLLALEKK